MREARHAGKPDLSVGQCELARHPALVPLAERQIEVQHEPGVAGGFSVLGKVAGHRVDRAFAHEAQEVRERARRRTVDGELGCSAAQVGDRGMRLAELGAEHPPARRVDRQRRALEPELAVDAFDRRPVRRVVERHAAPLHSDDELARLAIGKRETREIAGELEPCIGHLAANECALHPPACRIPHDMRHIAIGLRGIAARELCGDVDLAWTARRGPKGSRHASRRVRVGEFEPRDVDARPPAGALPAHRALQRLERNRRREHARQIEHAVARRQLHLAALFPRRERARQAHGAGKRVLRDDAELLELGARLERRRGVGGAFPLQTSLRERAARREAREIRAPALRERQRGGDVP